MAHLFFIFILVTVSLTFPCFPLIEKLQEYFPQSKGKSNHCFQLASMSNENKSFTLRHHKNSGLINFIIINTCDTAEIFERLVLQISSISINESSLNNLEMKIFTFPEYATSPTFWSSQGQFYFIIYGPSHPTLEDLLPGHSEILVQVVVNSREKIKTFSINDIFLTYDLFGKLRLTVSTKEIQPLCNSLQCKILIYFSNGSLLHTYIILPQSDLDITYIDNFPPGKYSLLVDQDSLPVISNQTVIWTSFPDINGPIQILPDGKETEVFLTFSFEKKGNNNIGTLALFLIPPRDEKIKSIRNIKGKLEGKTNNKLVRLNLKFSVLEVIDNLPEDEYILTINQVGRADTGEYYFPDKNIIKIIANKLESVAVTFNKVNGNMTYAILFDVKNAPVNQSIQFHGESCEYAVSCLVPGIYTFPEERITGVIDAPEYQVITNPSPLVITKSTSLVSILFLKRK